MMVGPPAAILRMSGLVEVQGVADLLKAGLMALAVDHVEDDAAGPR